MSDTYNVIISEDGTEIIVRDVGVQGPSGSGGDHGALTGLSDDDHLQYHTDARALTWLGTRSTSDLPEGTNKYYTAAQARTDLITASITDSDTTHAPSGDAVFDALALKQPLDSQLTDLAALSYASNALKVVRVNAAENSLELATISSGVSDHTLLTNIGTNTHAQIDSHISNTSNPHSVTKSQIGLSNVDDVQQMPMSYLDTDGTLSANSDLKIASQKAAKTYSDSKVSDDAYNSATWDSVTTSAPSKNAVRDKIETLMPISGGTFTGAVIESVVSLTDAATISVDATLGNIFTVTLGGNRTLGNPTGAVNGQKMVFRIRQDGTGSRTITLDTKYRLGSDITTVSLSTSANKTDYLGVIYHSSDDKFDVVAFVKGY